MINTIVTEFKAVKMFRQLFQTLKTTIVFESLCRVQHELPGPGDPSCPAGPFLTHYLTVSMTTCSMRTTFYKNLRHVRIQYDHAYEHTSVAH
jgi:hypothetical protein